ncbi:MAG TPA: AAA family ATPase [Candidatus Didemnitutus sp.]|nr:AAA family ATPase [Candidatus Didemnitutus sp.]
MIAAIHFRNFKALRSAEVRLGAFNLLVGPSGSGKTSLIQAILQLRSLAEFIDVPPTGPLAETGSGPQIVFRFPPPFAEVQISLGCGADELVCNRLTVHAPESLARDAWMALRPQLAGARAYLLDHYAMGRPSPRSAVPELSSNAGNLAAVLAGWQRNAPEAFRSVVKEFCRWNSEFSDLAIEEGADDTVGLLARIRGEESSGVTAANLSQGTLYSLAILTLAAMPDPPSILCLEEADRGHHPRQLREVRDALYRLSHPREAGLVRDPVQVVATTHSPYLLDLFKDHPEEVILTQKQGAAAQFQSLVDVPGVQGQLGEAPLGDLWFSGLLGGVPEE